LEKHLGDGIHCCHAKVVGFACKKVLETSNDVHVGATKHAHCVEKVVARCVCGNKQNLLVLDKLSVKLERALHLVLTTCTCHPHFEKRLCQFSWALDGTIE